MSIVTPLDVLVQETALEVAQRIAGGRSVTELRAICRELLTCIDENAIDEANETGLPWLIANASIRDEFFEGELWIVRKTSDGTETIHCVPVEERTDGWQVGRAWSGNDLVAKRNRVAAPALFEVIARGRLLHFLSHEGRSNARRRGIFLILEGAR